MSEWSGTTGPAKGAVLPQAFCIEQARIEIEQWGLPKGATHQVNKHQLRHTKGFTVLDLSGAG